MKKDMVDKNLKSGTKSKSHSSTPSHHTRRTKLQGILTNKTVQLISMGILFVIICIVGYIYLKPEQRIPDISGIPADFWNEFMANNLFTANNEAWPVSNAFQEVLPAANCATCKNITCGRTDGPVAGSGSYNYNSVWGKAPRQALTTISDDMEIYSEASGEKIRASDHESPFANLSQYLKGFNQAYTQSSKNPYENQLQSNNYATSYGCMGPMDNSEINQWSADTGPVAQDGYEDVGLTPNVERNPNIFKVSRATDDTDQSKHWYHLYRTDGAIPESVKDSQANAKYPGIPEEMKGKVFALDQTLTNIPENDTSKYWPQGMKSITFRKNPDAQVKNGLKSRHRSHSKGLFGECLAWFSSKDDITGMQPQISNLDVDIATTCEFIPMNTIQQSGQNNSCIIVPLGSSRKDSDSDASSASAKGSDKYSKISTFGKNARNYGSSKNDQTFRTEGKMACPAGYVMTSLNLNPTPEPNETHKIKHGGQINGLAPIDGATTSYPGTELTSITCCPSNCLIKGENNELAMGAPFEDGAWSNGSGQYKEDTKDAVSGTLLAGKTVNDWNKTTFSCPEGPYWMTGIWFHHEIDDQVAFNGKSAKDQGIKQDPFDGEGRSRNGKSNGGSGPVYGGPTEVSSFWDDQDRRTHKWDCECAFDNPPMRSYDVPGDNELDTVNAQEVKNVCQREREESNIATLKNPHARWKNPGAEAISIRCTPFFDNSCESCVPTAQGMAYCQDPTCIDPDTNSPRMPGRCCNDASKSGCDSTNASGNFCSANEWS